MAKKHIVLLRNMAKPSKRFGSAVMRADQLGAITAPYIGAGFKVRVMGFNPDFLIPSLMAFWVQSIPRDSIVIFVKFAAFGLTPEHLDVFHRRGIRVGLDFIDLPLRKIDPFLFDFYVASALSAVQPVKDYLTTNGRAGVPVEFLPHHHDPRLSNLQVPENRAFACCYFGNAKEVHIPDQIRENITFMAVNNVQSFKDNWRNLAQFPLHYSVRPYSLNMPLLERVYKPFTKGATAAAGSANIIAVRGFDDAAESLGHDYPFLLDNTKPETIVDGLRFAQDVFGGREWTEGLERIRAFSDQVRPHALAARLREIANSVL